MTHMVLHKKIEEIEMDVKIILELTSGHFISNDEDGNNKKIDRVCKKINFVKKLLSDVTGTYSQDRPEELGKMADRLSVVENNFTVWRHMDRPMSPFSCTSSFLDDEEEDQESGDKEKEDNEQCSIVDSIDENIKCQAFLSRVNLEDLILKLVEKENSNMRRKGKLFQIVGTILGVAVLAIGLVVAWFGSVEEAVYLVPT